MKLKLRFLLRLLILKMHISEKYKMRSSAISTKSLRFSLKYLEQCAALSCRSKKMEYGWSKIGPISKALKSFTIPSYPMASL